MGESAYMLTCGSLGPRSRRHHRALTHRNRQAYDPIVDLQPIVTTASQEPRPRLEACILGFDMEHNLAKRHHL